MPAKIKGPARLTDIEVDEVSLVDKAANKRKFLIVKNDEQISQEGVKNMTKDKVERVKKQSVNPEPEASDTDGTPITDAEAGVQPGVTAATDTGADAQPADGAETDEVAEDAQTELAKAVTALTGIVGDLAGKVKGIIAGEVAKDEAGAAAEPEATSEPVAAVEEVEAEKAGAKISKANLGKLTTAFTSIKSLLMELGVDVEGAGHTNKVKKEAGKPEVEPTVLAEISKVADGLTAVTKQLGEVSKRLDAVEGLDVQSHQAGDGGTSEPIQKEAGLWDSVIN